MKLQISALHWESVNARAILRQSIDNHLDIVQQLSSQFHIIESIAAEMLESLHAGGTIFWCGNGGSAADCQHMAAEFVGRFRRERQGLASVALTTDTSAMTAIANDYGFDQIFRRQVEALCAPGDVVVGISTSGNSQNVCLALQEAKKLGALTVSFTGAHGGKLIAVSDLALRIASTETARIQEAHILAGHLLCDLVEQAHCSNRASSEGDIQ
ncbi:MAG TPA: SIS domain-containing protein [Candidatus Saccharimonadales bacterium]|jgi:D-sedoheptulose 7-phosphate isomerase|nr:SIS domain-containing protein [Candidatus Saccharimonadales bacterium]